MTLQKRRGIRVAAVGLAAAGALGLYLWRANAPVQHGMLTRTTDAPRETFYLKTDEGFDNIRPVHFQIPFQLQSLEWHVESNQTLITLRFTEPVPPPILNEAGFCVEIVATHQDDTVILWWGHNLRPKLAPELTEGQAIVVDYRTGQALAQGEASFAGDTVELRLPMALRSVDVAYLRYAPSEQAFRESGGRQIVSSLRAKSPPPWGRRVRSLPGGYQWRGE